MVSEKRTTFRRSKSSWVSFPLATQTFYLSHAREWRDMMNISSFLFRSLLSKIMKWLFFSKEGVTDLLRDALPSKKT